MDIKLIIKFLSAAVIASFVTGIFGLIVAVKNNRRLLALEHSKQQFALNQERYKKLQEAFDELREVLPEESKLGHIIVNYNNPSQPSGIVAWHKIAEKELQLLYTHFSKYNYLFTNDEYQNVVRRFDVIDKKSKQLIEATDQDSILYAKERIGCVVELEEYYFELYSTYLRNWWTQ